MLNNRTKSTKYKKKQKLQIFLLKKIDLGANEKERKEKKKKFLSPVEIILGAIIGGCHHHAKLPIVLLNLGLIQRDSLCL